MCYKSIRSLKVFLQGSIHLNDFNEKLILKEIGGNFELIVILIQILIKKIVSKNNLPLQGMTILSGFQWTPSLIPLKLQPQRLHLLSINKTSLKSLWSRPA